MLPAMIIASSVAYVIYRLSLTVRKIRAQRAGDNDLADRLSARAFVARLGAMAGLLIVAFSLTFYLR